ncbi:MAG TPA: SH3 domain-containing protein [Burkholderiales bacterium]|nr:SH3 domain-containing protein [Burkholderiales bacterium]
MRRLAAAACLLLAAAPAQAQFLSVGENAAVLYDAPSRQAKALYVVSKHYPVEVIVNLEAWVKVRDHTGALSWVERRLLVEQRTVVVVPPSAEVRVRPEDGAPVAFVAVQNVALELLGTAPGGWLRVRHADGADGYLRANLVWGA